MITMPIYVVSLTKVSVQRIIMFTGSFPALYLLLFLPPLLAFCARRKAPKAWDSAGRNFHQPLLRGNLWIYLSWTVGAFVAILQISYAFGDSR